MSFKLPDPFDKRRDEKAITQRMAQVRAEVADLLADGWEVYTGDEVRVEHEAETRRMWLPKGKRTKIYVDRNRSSCSFFGALSLTTKKMRIYPIEGSQNTEQIILAMSRLALDAEELGERGCDGLLNLIARGHVFRLRCDVFGGWQCFTIHFPVRRELRDRKSVV